MNIFFESIKYCLTLSNCLIMSNDVLHCMSFIAFHQPNDCTSNVSDSTQFIIVPSGKFCVFTFCTAFSVFTFIGFHQVTYIIHLVLMFEYNRMIIVSGLLFIVCFHLIVFGSGQQFVNERYVSDPMARFNNPFKSPDIFMKLRNDPRTKDMLNDPDCIKLINALQTNPNALG